MFSLINHIKNNKRNCLKEMIALIVLLLFLSPTVCYSFEEIKGIFNF